MRSFVVVCDPSLQDLYLRQFIQDRNISAVGVFEYLETLKIAQVREIKLMLARHGGTRVFVFRAGLTVAAQNAMLKSLEELPPDSFVIFFVRRISDLLLTIQSRATIVRFGGIGEDSLKSSSKALRIDFSSEESIHDYLQGASSMLRQGIGRDTHLLSVLNCVYEILPLVEKNNLSSKMASDYINFQIEEMRS